MITHQSSRQDFSGVKEMSEIGTGEMAAGITTASSIKGFVTVGVSGGFDDHFPLGSECHAGSSVTRRQDAIKEVDALFHGFQNVLRITGSHKIPDFIIGDYRVGFFNHFPGQCRGFADHQSADGVTG